MRKGKASRRRTRTRIRLGLRTGRRTTSVFVFDVIYLVNQV